MEVLLRNETIREYDVLVSKNKVEEILTEYIRARYAYSNIKQIGNEFYNSSTGANYEFKPEMHTIRYSDRVGNKIAFKVDTENEVIEMEKDFTEMIKLFTEMEKDFFNTVLLGQRSQNIIEEKYNVTKNGLLSTKQSCILKIAMYFNVAVKK